MDLTRRQKEFVHTLLDLFRELRQPFHYSELAERLGVSPFTAYDMLRLLEEKGLVASQYQLAEDKSGPGRSEVVFVPTDRAWQVMEQAMGVVGGDDWAAVKEHLLERVQRGEIGGQDLAHQMLAHMPPDEPDVVRFCVELMTVIALRLRRQHGRQVLAHYLPDLLPDEGPCRPGLGILGGFALGLLSVRGLNDELDSGREERPDACLHELLDHVRRYQNLVTNMEPELCRRLAERLREVFLPANESCP